MRASRAALLSLLNTVALFTLFDSLLQMPWPNVLVGEVWPSLRDIMGLRLL